MEEETPLVSLEINGPQFRYEFRSCGKGGEGYHANEVKPEAIATNTSFHYSGRHDHGPLASLKEEGYYSHFIQALQEMKRETDIVIQAQVTKEMKGGANDDEAEDEIAEDGESGNETSAKKPRLHE
jgi:predicted CopG family antitoxin